MRNCFYKIFIITTVFFISNVAYTESDIQQGDILAFDPTRACDVLAVKLEKMKVELNTKKMTITDLEKSLRSAATPAAQYGNISLDYHKELDRFKSMKNDYDQLIVERENHCMPNSVEKSTN